MLIICIVGVLLASLYALDSIALIARAQGAISGEYAIYNHLSMVLLVCNRVAMALVLPMIGFMVDTGYRISQLTGAYFLACIMLGVFFIAFLIKPTSVLFPIRSLVTLLGWEGLNNREVSVFNRHRPVVPGSFLLKASVAQVFFILGLCVPSLFAVAYPEFRATLLQTGFVLNAVGTIINIFYIERGIAAVSRTRDQAAELASTVREIFVGRAVAAISTGLFFAVLSYWDS